MQQQEERRDGSLAVLAPETQDRTTRAMWVVVNLADLDFLPFAQLDRLPDKPAFRHAAIALDPVDVAIAAPHRSGLGPSLPRACARCSLFCCHDDWWSLVV